MSTISLKISITDEWYQDGWSSHLERRIYQLVVENDAIVLHTRLPGPVERVWGDAILEQLRQIDPTAAANRITARFLELNPQAGDETIRRFIQARSV